MKTIGLLGGTSWHSTVDYYRNINMMVNHKLGGDHSARCIIYSVNFNDITSAVYRNDFASIQKLVVDACVLLEKSGVGCIGLCANTLHRFYNEITSAVSVPVIHIAEETGKKIKSQSITKAALLGTKITMEEDFYSSKLRQYGIEVLVPEKDDREKIHSIIMGELTQGIIKPETKEYFLQIIQKLQQQGAGGIILGCTELPLIISQKDCTVPAFDTTEIHSESLVNFAI